MKRPVLLIGFNRPKTTAEVMKAIERYEPSQLFVAIDGPRSSKPGEAEVVANVVRIATQPIPNCETKTLIRSENLGCRNAVSGAIDWFFENVDAGIILEDDCVPAEDFFPFCDQLLDRYQDDLTVGMIGGTNVRTTWPAESSYFFGLGTVWGWATWASRWRTVDVLGWDQKEWFSLTALNLVGPRRWLRLAELNRRVANGQLNTWDFPWVSSLLVQGMSSVIPSKNLVTNIGFDGTGTHTSSEHSIGSIESRRLSFPLRHPTSVKFDRAFDREWMRRESSLPKLIAVRALERLGLIRVAVGLKRVLLRATSDSGR